MRENKLNNFFNSVKKNLPSFELVNPALFLPIEDTYNVHRFNTNFIFKVKSHSVLTYFFCRVTNRDQIILNSISKENESSLETIKYLSPDESKSKLSQIIILTIITLLNLDLILMMITYIANYRVMERIGKLRKLNIITVIGSVIGLLNFSVLGFRIPNLYIPSPLPFAPNIGYFNNNLYIMISLFLGFFMITSMIIRFYFNSNKIEEKIDFKTLEELKI